MRSRFPGELTGRGAKGGNDSMHRRRFLKMAVFRQNDRKLLAELIKVANIKLE